MKDQLSMFGPTILPDSTSAISSPVSVAGRSRSKSQAEPKSEDSGPPRVHVSRFRALDSDKAISTNDTSGPLFTASSPSADLQKSLENRLRARMDVNGSPEFVLTWKMHDMPSGVPICRLVASARPTSGNDFTGWPTPRAMTGGPESAERKQELGRTESGGGDLQAAAQMVAWPTPKGSDGDKGVRSIEGAMKEAERTKGPDLNTVAHMAGWPTPMAGTPAQKGYNEAGNNDSSRKTMDMLSGWPSPNTVDSALGTRNGEGQKQLCHTGADLPAGWATPAHRDYRHPNDKSYQERSGTTKGEQLPNQVEHSGPIALLSPAKMEKRAVLAPEFSLWLMGFPRAWESCAPPVTRSSRKSRPNS